MSIGLTINDVSAFSAISIGFYIVSTTVIGENFIIVVDSDVSIMKTSSKYCFIFYSRHLGRSVWLQDSPCHVYSLIDPGDIFQLRPKTRRNS